ncbi:MAG: Clp protease ClpP [Treponema sp.]|nr:Clp protease ClpP [Treponema sp.]
MKTVTIDGYIGYDWWTDSGVTAKAVKQQLDGILEGEEIHVEVNSPGGSVYEGAVIFNLLRDYAKKHPVTTRINCMALSMASYIALAARTVDKNAIITVCENSIVMIHNPYMYTWGDYRELKKDAEYLEKLAAMYSSVHAAVSGQSEKIIRAAMDEVSYYLGKEIVDAGFANNFDAIVKEETNDEKDKNINARAELIARAQGAFGAMRGNDHFAKEKDGGSYRSDIKKAAALVQGFNFPVAGNLATGAQINKPNGGNNKMKPEELLAKDKDCYDAVFALGEQAALEKERSRVQAHIMLGTEAKALEIAVKYIQGGESTTEEKIHAEYIQASMRNSRIDARNADDPGEINTDNADGAADPAALTKAFWAGAQGKTLEGKSWE